MKRRALKLVLFLLAFLVGGAIINVIVAVCFWGLTARAGSGTIPGWTRNPLPSTKHDSSMWERGKSEGWPMAPTQTLRQSKVGIGYCEMVTIINEFDPVGLTPEQWTQRARLRRMFTVESIQFGWPKRVLSFEQATSCAGWPLAQSTRRVGSQFGFLKDPTTVLWPGFAINTVFYALLLWGLFAVPGYIKRRRRIKRGLCAKCAYPVGVTSAVCSECGTPVHPRNALHGAAVLGGPATPARDYR